MGKTIIQLDLRIFEPMNDRLKQQLEDQPIRWLTF